jgi:hypothetical protein
LILSQYLIGLGFVPQRLPQQKAAGAKKSMLNWVPSTPAPGINRGKYRYPRVAAVPSMYLYLDGRPCSLVLSSRTHLPGGSGHAKGIWRGNDTGNRHRLSWGFLEALGGFPTSFLTGMRQLH